MYVESSSSARWLARAQLLMCLCAAGCMSRAHADGGDQPDAAARDRPHAFGPYGSRLASSLRYAIGIVRLCARRTRPVERRPEMCACPAGAPSECALNTARVAATRGRPQLPAASRGGASHPPDPRAMPAAESRTCPPAGEREGVACGAPRSVPANDRPTGRAPWGCSADSSRSTARAWRSRTFPDAHFEAATAGNSSSILKLTLLHPPLSRPLAGCWRRCHAAARATRAPPPQHLLTTTHCCRAQAEAARRSA